MLGFSLGRTRCFLSSLFTIPSALKISFQQSLLWDDSISIFLSEYPMLLSCTASSDKVLYLLTRTDRLCPLLPTCLIIIWRDAANLERFVLLKFQFNYLIKLVSYIITLSIFGNVVPRWLRVWFWALSGLTLFDFNGLVLQCITWRLRDVQDCSMPSSLVLVSPSPSWITTSCVWHLREIGFLSSISLVPSWRIHISESFQSLVKPDKDSIILSHHVINPPRLLIAYFYFIVCVVRFQWVFIWV